MILFICTFSFHVYVYAFVSCSHVHVRLRFCLRLRFRLRLRLRVRYRLRFRSRVLFRFEVWRLGDFSPTAKPWGSNLLIRRFAFSFGWKSPPAKKMIPMGVNKALDGKGRFLKPDYHYTTIFLAS